MALWANLHGGFVFGLVLIAPIALDAVVSAKASSRKIAGAALGGLRLCRAGRKLLHALWLEFAAGVAEDSRPRQRAAADHGMAAGGFRQPRRARDLPAARDRARAVARHQAAAAAHRAAAGIAAHGAGARPRRPKSWRCWRRWFLPRRWPRRSAATRVCIRGRSPRRAAGCSPASRCCWWREPLPLPRCIASSRIPTARRSRRSPN